jgi:predicted dehydrogenase
VVASTIHNPENNTRHITHEWQLRMNPVRIGIVGLGKNNRDRHLPGFRAIKAVEIISVCNRSLKSSKRAANQFAIPKTFDVWQDLVCDDDIDAVVIGTWPYVHCAIALAALEHGKHVLTEARMDQLTG